MSLNIGKNNLKPYESNIKCGEVVFANNTKFCFSCTFCKKKCEKVQEFFRHVLYDHLNYLDEYQLDEDCDDFLSDEILSSKKVVEDTTEFVEIKEDLVKKNKIGFSNHFEEFVSKNIPSNIFIKSEVQESEEEEYKEDMEELEFLLETDPIVQPVASKKKIDNTLHIEFLEEPSENEYEPENTDISETHSPKMQNEPEDETNSFNESEEESDEKNPIMTKDDKTKEKKFICSKCNKHFKTKHGAKRHMLNIHPPRSIRLECDICLKTFGNQAVLDKHMARHMGIKPYACEICGQFFSDKSNLNVHVLRHKGIKPHACSICDKRFHSSTELKLHTRSHTGERPFVCELCGRKFSNSGHLCSHRRRHYGEKRYECDVCQKRFFDRKLLNDHKIVHSYERPHECSTCGATFQRRKALLQHQKLHSGIKEYVCKLCDKSFAQNAGLYSHMKSH